MSTNPNETLAPAADPDGLEVKRDEVQEVSPVVMWDKSTIDENDAELYDFRPNPEVIEDTTPEDKTADPKGGSVRASVLADIYSQLRTPDIASRQSQETPASAGTENGSDSTKSEKEGENGSPTSSSETSTSAGKSEPPA